MTKCTIATHNGSAAHRHHNIRTEKVVSKEPHIDPNGHYEVWKDVPPREAYHKLFDGAVERYNAKQTRTDRKITNYYAQVEKDAKKHPVYEMIIGVYPGNDSINENTQKAILKEFVDGWQTRNPSLYMCGAYYHADEEGEPHVHIDYIPVARGYTKGMDTQNGLTRALEAQGFYKEGRETPQIKWQRSENEHLAKLCKTRGLEVQHPTQERKEHLDTGLYKAQKALESTIAHVNDLSTIQSDLKAQIGQLEALRDKAEQQAQKALDRKRKAFSRSWKKSNDGWTYNKDLEREIRTLVADRAKDVEAISHTDLDVERLHDEAQRLQAKAQKELYEAQVLHDDAEAFIRAQAEMQADRLFQEFLEQEYGDTPKGRAAEMEAFLKECTCSDKRNLLDVFNEEQTLKREKLKKSWDSWDIER